MIDLAYELALVNIAFPAKASSYADALARIDARHPTVKPSYNEDVLSEEEQIHTSYEENGNG